MPDFGSGLGQVIGGALGADDLKDAKDSVDATAGAGLASVNGIAGGFNATTAPYDTFGKSFLDPARAAIGDVRGKAKDTMGYDQFMAGYENTPAAQYQLQQADAVQNSSAAARGGLLSGANERELAKINTGIVAQNANTAYNEYLAGNSQQFGQLETALGNMFSAIGVGTTATGQQAGVANAQMGATSAISNANTYATANIAGNQAKNDQSKGTGFGSMFGGLGSMFAF